MNLYGKCRYKKNKEREYLRDEKEETIIWYKGMDKSRYDGKGIKDIEFGVFFCDNENVAKSYAINGSYVMHAHISVSDPYIIDAKNNGYQYIPWDCSPSDTEEFLKFKQELTKIYPVVDETTNRFSVDQIARFIRDKTSHDAVIIHNVYEEGIFNNVPVTDICIWDNACIEVIN